jgi:hypothetical protein
MRRKPLLDQAISERGVKAGLVWLSREAGLDDVEVWEANQSRFHPVSASRELSQGTGDQELLSLQI